MNKIVSSLEFLYYALLPYFGYLSLYFLHGKSWSVKIIPIFGWIVLLIYQIVFLGIFKERERDKTDLIPLVIPPVLIGINQIFFKNSLWNFFLEQTVLEIVAFIFAISIIFLFFKDNNNDFSWQVLGIIPIIVIILILMGSWGYIDTWIDRQEYFTRGSITNFFLFFTAFSIRVRSFILILNRIVKRKLIIKEIFPENSGVSTALIIGQIVIWIFIIPLIFGIIN